MDGWSFGGSAGYLRLARSYTPRSVWERIMHGRWIGIITIARLTPATAAAMIAATTGKMIDEKKRKDIDNSSSLRNGTRR